MRVLLILGHPRTESLGAALYRSFRDGLLESGVEFEELVLADMRFDPDVRTVSFNDQPVEPDLQHARALITWADHLVLVYPTWWGAFPARMKAFLDRVLAPGFAFRHQPDGDWEKLLQGKTAQLLTTMDTPPWVYRWIYGSPGHNALARATLGFCGIRTVRKTVFGPVLHSSARQRSRWIDQSVQEGLRLRHGALSTKQRLGDKSVVWLKAARLQFYPMTAIAYAAGALAAIESDGTLNMANFWLGWLALFFLELATVFSNDFFDFESDRRNRNAGTFTGGSQVLVNGELSFRELAIGIGLSLTLFLGLAGLLISRVSEPAAAVVALLTLAVLALGYTIPPLKLCHRGLGELDVALTHSVGVILCGYVFQGGSWHESQPWLLGMPLLVSVLPAIILSGVPDYEADKAASKRTLVVMLGPRRALKLAMVLVALAATLAVTWHEFDLVGGAFGAAVYLAVIHALALIWMLRRHLEQACIAARIDGLMALSLGFIGWFGLVPLWRLLT